MLRECSAAIFCGGDNLRIGRLAGIHAKTLLVTLDTPLLWRLIDQLSIAGFSRIVASTTPRLERQIADSVDHYGRSISSDVQLQVVASEAQQRGVVFGLRQVLEMAPTERCLTCLGDIFFLANPFPSFRMHVDADYGCLGVAAAAFDEELSLGGLVYHEQGKVLSILERPTTTVSGRPLRWSGIALSLRDHALTDLEAYTSDLPDDSPLGDFFEFQRHRGRDLRCVSGPDFVNVNAPDQLLLASLYARLEADTVRDPLSSSLAEAARSLRHDLAHRTSQAQAKERSI